jgi:hypothetical protein
MLETRRFDNPRCHIIFKVTVVKRNPETIETQTREKLGISIGKEILQPLVEEEFIFLGPKDSKHSRSVLGFMAGESSDEVLHTRIGQFDGSTGMEGKLTYFIHPPIAAPRKTTCFPLPSTTVLFFTWRIPVAMVQTPC